MGSIGVSDKAELKIVVAFAMILHKLPATFGLVTFLVSCKWTRGGVFQALIGFASSAPLMALATYWTLVSRSINHSHGCCVVDGNSGS